MKKSLLLSVCALSASALLCGCTATEKGAGTGAVVGGGLGAVIGHQSGHGAEGALIGAALGGLTGAAIGSDQENNATGQRKIQYSPSGNAVDVTGYPPGTQVRDPLSGDVFFVQ
ncbi:MAG: YMGG-like glycine zipper-containing protein [Candidatus Theseobacter exili]|nr:YMGG-like glycine zipper-containing protein [Candidatus Theseobacter exili]